MVATKTMTIIAPLLQMLATSVALLPHEAYCRIRPLRTHSLRTPSCFIHRPCATTAQDRGRVSSTNQSAESAFQLSMSSPRSSAQYRTSPSPWSPGKWKITLDFGRRKDESSERNDKSQLTNLLANDWGSNGGRLALSFEVMVTSDTNGSEDGNKSVRAWLGGKPTGTVECISHVMNDGGRYCASYINERGQQYVDISSGRWRIDPPLPLVPSYTKIIPGQASTLRFHLTLATSIQRNTISFPQGQLLLLQSNTFRTQQYLNGITTLLPYQHAMENTQRLLEDKLNHDSGDRRLDGNDLFETLGGYRDIAELVAARDARRREWAEIEGVLPKLMNINVNQKVDISKLLIDERWGVWPGDTELMTVERGVILAVVEKEKSKANRFPWMQQDRSAETVVVGKWSLVPILDDRHE